MSKIDSSKNKFKKSKNSTVQIPLLIDDCSVAFTLKIISGKWKAAILFAIVHKTNRFGSILRLIPKLNRQTLSVHLNELESDGLIKRVEYSEIPIRVEYYETQLGLALFNVLSEMKKWGDLAKKQQIHVSVNSKT